MLDQRYQLIRTNTYWLLLNLYPNYRVSTIQTTNSLTLIIPKSQFTETNIKTWETRVVKQRIKYTQSKALKTVSIEYSTHYPIQLNNLTLVKNNYPLKLSTLSLLKINTFNSSYWYFYTTRCFKQCILLLTSYNFFILNHLLNNTTLNNRLFKLTTHPKSLFIINIQTL